MTADRFYIITGGPGSGKTTLLTALEHAGFHTVPEAARTIIKEQVQTGGTALPWKDRRRYTRLMLDRSVESYQAATEQAKKHPERLFFFDRGIPDTLCYANMTGIGISKQMDAVARTHPYNKTVWMLPPWKEIYAIDDERKQDWAEAVFTYLQMKEIYTRYQYNVTEVPPGDVRYRSAFIIARLKL
ncbi:AAA family ATPase [Niabella aurantiaca]|uniref:AAA family ATPase n=1 Tax=Niabella aurantiaca TaxID=379900 RepID=UPI00037C8D1D|nr:AAA family ATPase [Niabella aurantiaca]